MVGKRTLPERRNGLLDPAIAPSHDDLIARRRLGQTNLAVKPGVAGVAKASKSESMGTFDYAHLRVPLPKDLSGSGIFTLKTSTSYPESYFLMRRSSDGYISATGMFKAAFPWASLKEEETERRFQKTFPSAGPDEVAGSVWIAPEEALRLSDEYGMRHWIVALLDPSPIEPGTKDKDKKRIQMPPKFEVDKATAPVVLPPSSSLRTTRSRSSRSASPTKMAPTPRKMATPRKPRATRSSVKPESVNGDDVKEVTKVTQTASEEVEVTNDAVEVTQGSSIEKTETIENGADVTDAEASPAKDADVVRIEVEETVEEHGGVETTTTNVKIDVPADHPELPEPEDPTEMIAQARKVVEDARELDRSAAAGSKSKRKFDEVEEAEAEEEVERPAKQAKTVYTAEQRLKKERMTTRALFGIGVMAAIGTAFQYFA